MTGAFLIGFLILGIIFIIWGFIDNFNDDFWIPAGVVSLILAALFAIAIPISRIDSKTNAEYVKVFQQTLNENRGNTADMSVFERATIIQEINSCNSTINKWKVKGKHWYNNKWYLHPDTQKAEFIK